MTIEYLVDSCVLNDFVRNKQETPSYQRVLELLNNRNTICINMLIYTELLQGISKIDEAKFLGIKEFLEQAEKNKVIKMIDIDRAIYEEAIDIQRKLHTELTKRDRYKGILIDVLVYATAKCIGARIITCDGDFKKIEEVTKNQIIDYL